MFADFTDRNWLWAAAALYVIGFVQGTVSLLRGGRPSGTATYVLIAVGYVLQFIGLGIRGKAIGGSPLSNTFEVFQFTAWSAITLYLVIGVRFRNSLLGYFTSCLTAALTLVSLSIPEWDATHRTHIFGDNPWIELHATFALFSYGIFALLSLTSIMFLLRNYSLKSKRIGGWFSFLPSILDLDHIGVRLLAAGVIILAISLGVGSVYWVRDTSTVNLTKLFSTIAVWLLYTATLGLRLRGRLLARWFAWTCLGLFVLALLSLGPVDASRHSIDPKDRLHSADVAAPAAVGAVRHPSSPSHGSSTRAPKSVST
ncbi:MAG TPA: cytochrome c biogenesis protein CcsA [Opitutaceae bacterium]|nr:cytochrome c biogenesis protein CcsA [Opitutaceae bacterium]